MMEYPFKDLLPLDEVLEREGYYKDWTHLDPEVFYSLTQISEYIKTKGYGVDVRLLIAQLAEHFGLKSTQIIDLANLLQREFENLEGVTQSFTNNINSLVAQMEADKNAVIANATVDSEVILARGGKATLGQRLDETTDQLAQMGLNVKSLGAVGDGVNDDTPFIQEAIDILSDLGGGTVFIPQGIFLLSSYGSDGIHLYAKSKVNIVGTGKNSVLKLPNNRNDSGPDPKVLRNTESAGLNDVIYKDFVVDMNGENNISANITSKANVVIGSLYGNNIEINNVTVKDNAGRQTFSFGNNERPHSIGEIKIKNCHFINFGNGVSGNNLQTDHSCIYVQAEKATIANNTFINPPIFTDSFRSTGTAIENHSSNSMVYGNYGANLKNAFNIVATWTDQVNSQYFSNSFDNIIRAAEIWVFEDSVLDEVHIYDNVFKTQFPETSLDLFKNVSGTIKSFYFERNKIEYSGVKMGSFGGGGIHARNFEKLSIKDNELIKLPSQGINIINTGSSSVLEIERNTIIDNSNTTGTATNLKNAISVASSSAKEVTIRENKIKNIEGDMLKGIFIDKSIENLFIENNTIENIGTPIDITARPTFTILQITHKGGKKPENLRAGIGSFWTEVNTGIEHHKKRYGTFATGWLKNIYAAQPPSEGTFNIGDRVININPTNETPNDWIYTNAGQWVEK